ncbi:MAG TPA: arginine--tRNA ligase [Solirubrobacteraceae bacterium]|nr:arginine--tRNA ligase [Solirubrobacteraceae bacterium]
MSKPPPDHATDDRSQEGATERAAWPLEGLRDLVLAAAQELRGAPVGASERAGGAVVGGGRGAITLERPPRAELGDYSTNAALLLAPGLGEPPRTLAERLGHVLERELGADLLRFEVAGPGFLNLYVADSWLSGALAAVLGAGESFGGGVAGARERILVEFVSANPTGPMHVGHARNAAYGDALARLLAFVGHEVEREFYVNDAGSQIRKLGESIQALARGQAVPEDGYKGDYVVELAGELAGASSIDADELGRAAVAVMMGRLQASLAAFAVSFDHWQYESTLHEGSPSLVEHTLAILEEQGHTYRSEGALWLRTTDFGDDKDRVLVRSNGEHTYFASDIAYHQDKRERGFQRQIDVWGADHHGYVRRVKAAYQALGGDPDELELLIMQLVHLVSAGERAQMSKRAGEFVTLEDLQAQIGVDAARWYLLARSHDTTVDLDLDLVREQSSENPVYYVQYAHARIASILTKAGAQNAQAAVAETMAPDAGARREPLDATERALVQQLLAFPSELAEAAQRRAPHRIAAYALELAQGFTAFYRDCRVLGAEPSSLELWRIALCVASGRTIARCLSLLGVSAPDEM